MCTIVFAWQATPSSWGTRVVLAANRDELYARPSDPPMRLADDPAIWGGRDKVAGGTWLAITNDGRIAAVTNRHPNGHVPPRDDAKQSRGQIPIDLLRGSDAQAVEQLNSMSFERFNPVNVLYVGHEHAWVLSLDESTRQLSVVNPGVHVLGESNLDDTSDKSTAILAKATSALSQSRDLPSLRDSWITTLSSHQQFGDGEHTAACIHADRFGTVSSATLVIGDNGSEYLHANGPPCITSFGTYPMGRS